MPPVSHDHLTESIIISYRPGTSGIPEKITLRDETFGGRMVYYTEPIGESTSLRKQILLISLLVKLKVINMSLQQKERNT